VLETPSRHLAGYVITARLSNKSMAFNNNNNIMKKTKKKKKKKKGEEEAVMNDSVSTRRHCTPLQP
jgi:hypothetical protein